MLKLNRRFGESIRIGDDIEIVNLGVRDKQVRIGIAAPKEVIVLKKELYYRKKSES